MGDVDPVLLRRLDYRLLRIGFKLLPVDRHLYHCEIPRITMYLPVPRQPERVSDSFVHYFSVQHVESESDFLLDESAFEIPLLAISTAYGRVAFVRATVDVNGTAPGMFATQ